MDVLSFAKSIWNFHDMSQWNKFQNRSAALFSIIPKWKADIRIEVDYCSSKENSPIGEP